MASVIKVLDIKRVLRLKKSEEYLLSRLHAYATMRYAWELEGRKKEGAAWEGMTKALSTIEEAQLSRERRMALLSKVVGYVDRKINEGDRTTCVS